MPPTVGTHSQSVFIPDSRHTLTKPLGQDLLEFLLLRFSASSRFLTSVQLPVASASCSSSSSVAWLPQAAHTSSVARVIVFISLTTMSVRICSRRRVGPHTCPGPACKGSRVVYLTRRKANVELAERTAGCLRIAAFKNVL